MKAAEKIPVYLILVILVTFSACLGFWFLRTRSGELGSKSAASIIRDRAGLPLSQTRRSGTVIISRLEKASPIDGFPCSAGWIHFYDSGKLKAFFLGEPTIIQGIRIPSGTWVQLNPDSTLARCAFPFDTDVQGYVCRGGRGGAEGVTTAFYPSGRLSAFFPREDLALQGVLCEASVFSPVYLHENGNLKQCVLARDEVVANRSLSSGQTLVMNLEGQIQSASEPSWFGRIRNWTRKRFL